MRRRAAGVPPAGRRVATAPGAVRARPRRGRAMTRNRRVALGGPLLPLALAAGCTLWKPTRPQLEPPPPGITPTRIDYVDTDGFDTVFESALVNQDPAIIIQTHATKPDWGDRLNAWIAAWN